MASRPDITKLILWLSLQSDGSDSHTGEVDFSAVNGPVSHAAAKVGNGADFDYASSQYYSVADPHAGQVGANSFTISGWIKSDGDWQIKPTYNGVWRCGNSVNSGGVLLRMAREDPQTPPEPAVLAASLFGDDSDPGSESTIHGDQVYPDTWYFFAAVHNATANTWKIYGDAVTPGTVAQEATETYTFTPADPAGRAGTIGYAGTVNYLEGIIDEFTIWNDALTLAELQYLCNDGDGISYAAYLADAGSPSGYNKVDLSLGVRL